MSNDNQDIQNDVTQDNEIDIQKAHAILEDLLDDPDDIICSLAGAKIQEAADLLI